MVFASGDPVSTHAGIARPLLAVDDHDDNGKMDKCFETTKVIVEKRRKGHDKGKETSQTAFILDHNKHMMPCEPAVERESEIFSP